MSNLPEATDDFFVLALNEEEQPSEPGPRLDGAKLAAIIVVMACLLLAAAITIILIRISHRQEQAATEKRQKDAKEKESELTDYIICRYYTREEEAERRRKRRQPKRVVDENLTEATYYSRSNSASSSSVSGDARTEYLRTIGYSLPQNQPAAANEIQVEEELCCLECALCSEEFTRGDVVCESNNPKCQHEFHKECMMTWLNIQNSCPICNLPYVLQSV